MGWHLRWAAAIRRRTREHKYLMPARMAVSTALLLQPPLVLATLHDSFR